jgi:hypothetical protein
MRAKKLKSKAAASAAEIRTKSKSNCQKRMAEMKRMNPRKVARKFKIFPQYNLMRPKRWMLSS